MNSKRLGSKQFSTLSEATARFNFWIGAVRSGKTYASVFKLAELILNGPPGDVIICGVSRSTIQTNVIITLFEILDFPPPPQGVDHADIHKRRINFIGASNEMAVRTLKGRDGVIGYVDEVTEIPEAVFDMFDSRFTHPDSKILCTANPAGPNHWLKVKYLENPKYDLKHFKFYLDDNPILDNSFKEHIKNKNKGMWYRRYVLGEWAAADGLIYECFSEKNIFKDDPYPPAYYIAGVDYGLSNASCCLLIGVYRKGYGQIRVFKEYYYDYHKSGRQKVESEIADDIYAFLYRISNLKAVYVDPSALGLRTELERKGLPVEEADNDVKNGISSLTSRIGNQDILIHESCKNLINSMYSYVWDKKRSEEGEDKPVKENDHAPDALRYAVYTRFGADAIEDQQQSITAEQLKREMYGYNPMELLSGSM